MVITIILVLKSRQLKLFTNTLSNKIFYCLLLGMQIMYLEHSLILKAKIVYFKLLKTI